MAKKTIKDDFTLLAILLIPIAIAINLKLYKTITEGTYVRLQPQAAPSLFRILKDVCRILDYREAQLPEIYVYHAMDRSRSGCWTNAGWPRGRTAGNI